MLSKQGARWAAPAAGRAMRFASLRVPHRAHLFIDNKWCDAEGGRTFPVFNPAKEEEIFQCARASAADVDRAVRGAKAAFHGPDWGRQSVGKDRGDMLRKMAAGLREQREDFSVLESLDNGKPINEARADIDACIGLLDYYSGFADRFEEEMIKTVKTEDTDFEVRLVKQPAGVMGLVTPWNFPLMQTVVKVAPALAAGCSMVLKPSSVCTATSLRLGDLALEAGLPPGALNIIAGTGSEAGAALLDHRHIQMISFTGSSGIGHTVLNAAAKRLVPAHLELGGKGAIVVFDDVDIDSVVDWIMIGIFMCSGQVCSATSRLVVHRGVEKKLLERLAAAAQKLRIGDPLEESTQLGSLTSKDAFDTVVGFVDRAKKEGAEVICGGNSVKVDGKGYFYEATVLKVTGEMEAWREEIFGPVLTVQSFDTEEEAVRLANDTVYGLANAVVSDDPERCERVAQQLHAGVVWKNCSNSVPVEAPFGGFGESGFGKEYGAAGFEAYIQTKVITGCKPGFSWKWYA